METALSQLVVDALPEELPQRLGVAVSGGGDSIALLTLLHGLAPEQGWQLFAVTVNHGLREEAAAEAECVAAYCAHLGVPHQTLDWVGWDGSGNVQKAARDARYALMAEWAQDHSITTVALGHTMDDQAETVLMRLARGAGVDGLSAMAPVRHHGRVSWVRPLLGIERNTLRAYLQEKDVSWCEDPSNDEPQFKRIKARRTLELLKPLGVDAVALAQVADHMQSAQKALAIETRRVAEAIVTERAGGLEVSYDAFSALPEDIARRLVLSAIKWITGTEYGPRGKSLSGLLKRLPLQESATLEGCRFLLRRDKLWIFREYRAVSTESGPVDARWDGRWRLRGPKPSPAHRVAALGAEGLKYCTNWRDTGLPRDLLLACPAVWQGRELIAAPLAGNENGWCVNLGEGDASFFRTLISH